MPGPHDAPGPLSGYLYQVRYALLRVLKEARRNPGRTLLIEKFDDVVFEEEGRPIELIQTKHHGTEGNVSDKSVDVWRTLSIWMDRLKQDPTGADNTRLVLVTTNTALEGSALSMLREFDGTRNEPEALKLLMLAAETSKNSETENARSIFRSLSDTERRILARNVWVLDQAPNIVDMREEIADVLHYAAPAERIASFVDDLEGWWFARIVTALQGDGVSEIPVVSVERKVSELRERFKLENLIVDDSIENTSLDLDTIWEQRTFVRQLRLVDVSYQEVGATVYDYYRAFEQRSRWARESLLLDGETESYDRKLYDAWERRFLAKTADLDATTEEAEKRALGRSVFRWSREYQKPFRNRDEIWLSSGSFQILSDYQKLGWHPDYVVRLDDEDVEAKE